MASLLNIGSRRKGWYQWAATPEYYHVNLIASRGNVGSTGWLVCVYLDARPTILKAAYCRRLTLSNLQGWFLGKGRDRLAAPLQANFRNGYLNIMVLYLFGTDGVQDNISNPIQESCVRPPILSTNVWDIQPSYRGSTGIRIFEVEIICLQLALPRSLSPLPLPSPHVWRLSFLGWREVILLGTINTHHLKGCLGYCTL